MTKRLVTISLFIFWAVVVVILIAGLVFYDNNKQNASPEASVNDLVLKPGEKIILNFGLNQEITRQTLADTNQNIQNNLLNSPRYPDGEAEDD